IQAAGAGAPFRRRRLRDHPGISSWLSLFDVGSQWIAEVRYCDRHGLGEARTEDARTRCLCFIALPEWPAARAFWRCREVAAWNFHVLTEGRREVWRIFEISGSHRRGDRAGDDAHTARS